MMSYNVLVRGALGNVGRTITNLLLNHRDDLNLGYVYAHRHSHMPWRLPQERLLADKGAILCANEPNHEMVALADIKPRIHYIFECASASVALDEQKSYSSFPELLGACAQGSEKGFGIPFMSGVNESAVVGKKFVHIVSCNTHGTGAILQSLCRHDLSLLAEADVVVVRRSEDLGAHKSPRLVGATVVSRHGFGDKGTHHAADVVDLFRTCGTEVALCSSDATTPSELLHAVRFHLVGTREWNREKILKTLREYDYVAETNCFDSNYVFEAGRRYGLYGRIYSHAVVITNNLLFNGNRLRGWAFVPQEGASILSTLHAYLLQTRHPSTEAVITSLKERLLRQRW